MLCMFQQWDIQNRIAVGNIHTIHTEAAQNLFDLLFVCNPS
jgi:hypothetical protein